MPEFKIKDPETGRTVTLRGDSPPTEQELIEIFDRLGPVEQPGIMDAAKGLGGAIEEGFQSIPGAGAVSEFASGVVRGTGSLLDIVPQGIAGGINLLGGDVSIPKFEDIGAPKGSFGTIDPITGEPDLVTEAIATAGEFIPAAAGAGGLLRSAASKLPAFTSGETVGRGLIRQLGQTTAAGDIGIAATGGAGSAVGEEIGGETGALVGSILAPIAGVGAGTLFKGLLNAGKDGIRNLVSGVNQSVSGFSDDGASTLLAEAMIRDNVSPDEIVQRLQQLGPEAIPADAGASFARLLRTASNKIPRIQGQQEAVLNPRQQGQGARVLNALDDQTGTSSLSVDDEIERLNRLFRPRIDELYSAARTRGEEVFSRIRPATMETLAGRPPEKSIVQKILEGQPAAGTGVKRKADLEMRAKALSGEPITQIDMIDATKRALDDEIQAAIRKGEANKSRSLVKIKNNIVREADEQVPEYGQARNVFAGKAALENAADFGMQFIKMKPRDIAEITRTMGASEKKMYQLGAKEAIIDEIDKMQTTADAAKRLFGKNGSIQKLRSLFDTEEQFNRFNDVLRREADFVYTRRAAQSNSMTAQQVSDISEANQVISDAVDAFSSPNQIVSILNRISAAFSKQATNEQKLRAFEEAGDILLAQGMDPNELQRLLRAGAKQQLEAALKREAKKQIVAPRASAIGTEVIQEFLQE